MEFQKVFQTQDVPERAHTSCAYYRTAADGIFPMHCHSHYELSFIASGTRYEICEGKNHLVGAGGLFFIPPFAFHANKNVTPVDVMVIQFSPNLLYGNSSEMGRFTLTRPKGESLLITPSKSVREILLKILDFCLALKPFSTANEFHRNSLILELLSLLIDTGELTISDSTNVSTKMPELDAVINHILSHPDTRTDMKQAAKLANMSYYAFSRMFKEAIGVNFSDYCNIIRVRLAEELLITTSLSVSEIAEKTGIGTQSYFSRLFKQQSGISPTEYRAKFGLDAVNKKQSEIPFIKL